MRCLDFSERVVKALLFWKNRWATAVKADLPPLPPMKTFVLKFNLSVLDDYRKPAPPSFWDSFPSNLVTPGTSLVNPVKLKVLALQEGFADLALPSRN